jgi:hypothetical protein
MGSPDPVLGAKAGVFLAAICVLLAVGLYRHRPAPGSFLLLLARIDRASGASPRQHRQRDPARQLVLIPFVVLTSVYGARRLLQHPASAVRVNAVLLLMSLPIQFAYFAPATSRLSTARRRLSIPSISAKSRQSSTTIREADSAHLSQRGARRRRCAVALLSRQTARTTS